MTLPRIARPAALVVAAAVAVAVACLATPLSPADAITNDMSRTTDPSRTSGPFVLSYTVPSVNTHYGLAPLERDRPAITGKGTSVESALAKAATYTFPTPGTRGPIAGVGAAEGLCLGSVWGSAYLGGRPCDGGSDQSLTIVWEGARGGYVIKKGAYYLAATAQGVKPTKSLGSASLLSPEAVQAASAATAVRATVPIETVKGAFGTQSHIRFSETVFKDGTIVDGGRGDLLTEADGSFTRSVLNPALAPAVGPGDYRYSFAVAGVPEGPAVPAWLSCTITDRETGAILAQKRVESSSLVNCDYTVR